MIGRSVLRRTALPIIAAALLLTGCGGDAALPDQVQATEPATVTTVAPTFATCTQDELALDATRSYQPEGPLPGPGQMPEGTKMAEIKESGRLVVGVSADTLLFDARNPITGRIEGFDGDILKEVALAIFGPQEDIDSVIEYRVINYAERLPALESRAVDIVAHTMTINCNRWKRIAFSSTYFEAGQKVLVKNGSEATSIEDLAAAGARVCAPAGSTNIDQIDIPKYTDAGLIVVSKPDISDCLVAMQQGEADAATGDDTVLAGFAAQDPNTEVVGEPFSEEPYGLGINQADVEFVQFVNSVLEQVRTNGRWQEIYQTRLIDTGGLTGPVPEPPPATYGRTVGE